MKNHRAGHVEDAHLNPYVFESQYNTFHSFGYGAAPSGHGTVGDPGAFWQKGGEDVYSAKRRKTTAEKKAEAERRAAEQAAAAAQADAAAPFALQNRAPWAAKEVRAAGCLRARLTTTDMDCCGAYRGAKRWFFACACQAALMFCVLCEVPTSCSVAASCCRTTSHQAVKAATTMMQRCR